MHVLPHVQRRNPDGSETPVQLHEELVVAINLRDINIKVERTHICGLACHPNIVQSRHTATACWAFRADIEDAALKRLMGRAYLKVRWIARILWQSWKIFPYIYMYIQCTCIYDIILHVTRTFRFVMLSDLGVLDSSINAMLAPAWLLRSIVSIFSSSTRKFLNISWRQAITYPKVCNQL